MKDMEVQLIRPPIPSGHGPGDRMPVGSGLNAHHRAFADIGGLVRLILSLRHPTIA